MTTASPLELQLSTWSQIQTILRNQDRLMVREFVNYTCRLDKDMFELFPKYEELQKPECGCTWESLSYSAITNPDYYKDIGQVVTYIVAPWQPLWEIRPELVAQHEPVNIQGSMIGSREYKLYLDPLNQLMETLFSPLIENPENTFHQNMYKAHFSSTVHSGLPYRDSNQNSYLFIGLLTLQEPIVEEEIITKRRRKIKLLDRHNFQEDIDEQPRSFDSEETKLEIIKRRIDIFFYPAITITDLLLKYSQITRCNRSPVYPHNNPVHWENDPPFRQEAFSNGIRYFKYPFLKHHLPPDLSLKLEREEF